MLPTDGPPATLDTTLNNAGIVRATGVVTCVPSDANNLYVTLAARELNPGIHIIATDPGSVKDFEAFSKQTGNELLESREDGGRFYFLLKKS